MAGYRPLLQRIERELDSMERLGKRLNQHFVEMDQELRLASRLQQDFLPRQLLRLGDVKFAALYRPAGFVSGDIYDVTRVDEDHVAFYVADAVGHGVAAGLLTMFIKQAVRSKRIDAEDYELLSPAETIAELNEVLAAQDLSNSQFVSACYCLLNVKTHVLRFARAGHPYPIRVSADGCLTELKSEGGLLGLFPGEQFADRSVQLTPGDRVVLLTDGLEDAFPESRGVGLAACGSQQFANLVRQPAEQAVAGLADLLDGQQGSLEPQDDVTLVVLELAHDTGTTTST
jgi:sigma-B regulation protein RsbU (phosphoserine phosphatase)